MDKKALAFLSRFSAPPNKLGFCGNASAEEKFNLCVSKGKCSGIETELKKFIVLHPYLKTLSNITGLPKFSYKVAEAYWIGNSEINKAKTKHYDLLLTNFKIQGVPEQLLQELAKDRPKDFLPTHLFQVLHVGAGRSPGTRAEKLKGINNCMIRWGKVLKVSESVAEANLNSLETQRGRLHLTKKREKVEISGITTPNLKKGQVVAVHWHKAVKTLTKNEQERLLYWTRKVISSIRTI